MQPDGNSKDTDASRRLRLFLPRLGRKASCHPHDTIREKASSVINRT